MFIIRERGQEFYAGRGRLLERTDGAGGMPTTIRKKQVVVARSIGTVVEWCDYPIHGTAAALVFSGLGEWTVPARPGGRA